MKSLSTLCLLIAVASLAAGSYGMYSLGGLGDIWRYFNSFYLGPVIFLAVVVMVACSIISLFQRGGRGWCAAMLSLFFIALAVQLYAMPSPNAMIVRGIHDRVLRANPPDELRHFARDFHQAIPYLAINRGMTQALDEKQSVAYAKMKLAYPFMTWSLEPGEGPSIYERDNRINVEWGGAAAGKWGFSVTLDGTKNESDKGPAAELLPISDDIFFYRIP